MSPLKKNERLIMDKLIEAHRLFINLPVQHPSDQLEWVAKLHDLQRIVMARQIAREDDSFVNLSPGQHEIDF